MLRRKKMKHCFSFFFFFYWFMASSQHRCVFGMFCIFLLLILWFCVLIWWGTVSVCWKMVDFCCIYCRFFNVASYFAFNCSWLLLIWVTIEFLCLCLIVLLNFAFSWEYTLWCYWRAAYRNLPRSWARGVVQVCALCFFFFFWEMNPKIDIGLTSTT